MKNSFRVSAMTLASTVAGLLACGTALAQAEAPATAAAHASSFTSSQIVVRDATTGALRAATPAEANALAASAKTAAPAAAKAVQLPQRAHASGARGMRLSDEYLNHHVLVRQADGQMVSQCLHGPDEAAKFHQQPLVSTKTATAPTE